MRPDQHIHKNRYPIQHTGQAVNEHGNRGKEFQHGNKGKKIK